MQRSAAVDTFAIPIGYRTRSDAQTVGQTAANNGLERTLVFARTCAAIHSRPMGA